MSLIPIVFLPLMLTSITYLVIYLTDRDMFTLHIRANLSLALCISLGMVAIYTLYDVTKTPDSEPTVKVIHGKKIYMCLDTVQDGRRLILYGVKGKDIEIDLSKGYALIEYIPEKSPDSSTVFSRFNKRRGYVVLLPCSILVSIFPIAIAINEHRVDRHHRMREKLREFPELYMYPKGDYEK